MKPEDRSGFIEVVIGLAELKGKQLSAPALELYWRAMQDWRVEDFRQAAQQLLRTCEFMPTPKDFEDLRKAGSLTAGEAWAAVLEHIKGGYRSGGLNPETDQAVRALGGYRALAMMDLDQLPWQERRFAEHYDGMTEVAETRAALPHIAGPRLAGPQPIANLLLGPRT